MGAGLSTGLIAVCNRCKASELKPAPPQRSTQRIQGKKLIARFWLLTQLHSPRRNGGTNSAWVRAARQEGEEGRVGRARRIRLRSGRSGRNSGRGGKDRR